MMNFYRINYEDLIKNYEEFLRFAISKSDLFSVITYQKKPYSKEPPCCGHDNELQPLSPHLKRQIVGIKHWSNDSASDNHTVMNIYSSNKDTLKTMFSLKNFLLSAKNQFPEDLCFYRGNTIWIATVSHEALAFLYSAAKEDLEFFKKNDIRCYEESAMKIYELPK